MYRLVYGGSMRSLYILSKAETASCVISALGGRVCPRGDSSEVQLGRSVPSGEIRSFILGHVTLPSNCSRVQALPIGQEFDRFPGVAVRVQSKF